MIVREAGAADIDYVCHHLRPADVVEQFATRFYDDPDQLVAELQAVARLAIKQYALCTDDGVPASIVAAYLKAPGVAAMQICGTARTPELAWPATLWGRRRFIPLVLMPNVRLAETRILADHGEALRWAAACGFRQVGGPLPLGKHGEQYVHVAWTNGGG